MTTLTDSPPRVSELLAAAADNARATARELLMRLREYPDASVDHATIKRYEQRGDDLTRDIVHLLLEHGDSVVDGQELFALAGAIDDVVDHMEHVSDLLDLYKVEAAMQQALDQCDVLVRATALMADALASIQAPTRSEGAGDVLSRLKEAEDEGDQLERTAIAALFEHEDTNPRVIIQWKDLFEGLEAAIDACERAGMIIGNIMLKAR